MIINDTQQRIEVASSQLWTPCQAAFKPVAKFEKELENFRVTNAAWTILFFDDGNDNKDNDDSCIAE